MKKIKTNPSLEILDPVSGQIRNKETGQVFMLSPETLQLLAFFNENQEVGDDFEQLGTLIKTDDVKSLVAFVEDLVSQGIIVNSDYKKQELSSVELSDMALVEKPNLTCLSVPVASLQADYRYDFAFVGLPFDLGSTGFPGSRYGPNRLRELSAGGMDYRAQLADGSSAGWPSENGVALCKGLRIVDVGDVIHQVGESFSGFFDRVTSCIDQILKRGAVPISIGGDHSCLYPIIRSLSKASKKRMHLIVLDAHTDLAEYDSSISHNHGNVVSRILKENLVAKVTHVGLRGMVGKPLMQDGYKAIYAGKCQTVKSIIRQIKLDPKEDVYISFDIDVIDPVFAPGTGTPIPGGLNPRVAIDTICQLITGQNVIGFDVVEYNPMRDVNDLTGNLLMYALPQILHSFTQKVDVNKK